jgi:hypothetical protein
MISIHAIILIKLVCCQSSSVSKPSSIWIWGLCSTIESNSKIPCHLKRTWIPFFIELLPHWKSSHTGPTAMPSHWILTRIQVWSWRRRGYTPEIERAIHPVIGIIEHRNSFLLVVHCCHLILNLRHFMLMVHPIYSVNCWLSLFQSPQEILNN